MKIIKSESETMESKCGIALTQLVLFSDHRKIKIMFDELASEGKNILLDYSRHTNK